jgi:hypothetical protein
VSRTVRGWLLLAAAVLAGAAMLWVLQPRSPTRERAADEAARGDGTRRDGAAGRGATGVAARETTISAAGWVRGQVVDTDGGAVGEGTLVLWCLGSDDGVALIEGGVLELDEEGRFSGPACRGRLVCPELRHPALVPAEPWSLRPGTEATLEARMLPRLWGRVVDPGGAPVAGAVVSFQAPPDEDDPTVVPPVVATQTSSDADGEFSVARIERPPCDPCQAARQACPEAPLPVADRVRVTARAPGWAPGSRVVELDVEGVDADVPVDVTLRPATAAITGTLVDAEGRPLPRALVLARSQSQPHEQHRAEAGDGTFTLEGLAEGPYAVRAIQDGRELVARPDVAPGTTVALELTTALRDVVLELVDEEGSARAGAEVDGGPFRRARADAEGRLRAQRVAPGTYILRIRPSGVGKARAHDLVVPDREDPEISQPIHIVVAAEG